MRRIDKRIPFGFSGDWADLFVLHFADVLLDVSKFEKIEYQKKKYVKIPQKVQIVKGSDLSSSNTLVNGLVLDGTNLTVTTTDAEFDNKTKKYKCIIQNGDILRIYGELWICNTTTEQVVSRTPKEQVIYSIEAVKII